MFLTITIDTSQKNRTKGAWRKPLNLRKRSLQQKVRSWVKQFKAGQHYYRPAAF